jgi:peroxiredoxin/tetratricopeptide (TPR) repeat protein
MLRLCRVLSVLVFLACVPAVAWAQAAKSDGEIEAARITRRIATLAGWPARVDFAISSRGNEAKTWFNEGILRLHALDAAAADRAFFRVTELEPDCAMAWWGLAMAHVENRVLARYYLEKAAEQRAQITPRERQWIAALETYLVEGTAEEDRRNHFVNALNRLATEYPADVEASAFLVRQLLDNRNAGMSVPFLPAIDALIAQMMEARPNHPIALYRVLLWERDQPERVAESVEIVTRLLADSPQACTAAGRVFERLSQPAKAIACLGAALEMMRKRSVADRLALLAVPGYLETTDLLIGQLRGVRRSGEALALARHLIELPSAVASDALATIAGGAGMERMEAAGPSAAPFESSNADATATGQRRLLEILLAEQRWDEIRTAVRHGYLVSANPEIQARRAHAMGLLGFAQRDAQGGETQIQALEQLGDQLRRIPVGHTRNEKRQAIQSLLTTLATELASHRGDAAGAKPPRGSVPATPISSEVASQSAATWTPELAPPLQLPDQHGNPITLTQFDGRPLLLVFYRGAGCPHCIEQLAAIAPLNAEFEQAGITVLGISTDTVEGLQESFKAVGAKTALPFQLVSDHPLAAFRSYHAVAAPADQALHGLFLVDAHRRVLWQNISVEPFMSVKALLAEAKRTLPLWAESPPSTRRKAVVSH